MPTHPLSDLRVVELAGLAPGPFCGMLLADYGASVLRIDGPQSPKGDVLARHKSSISLNLKSPRSRNLFLALIAKADVLIDPYRPGVLERLDLSPDSVLLKVNPRLTVARLTGYRREGEYGDRAGHDINYLAVSGVLSLLGRAGERPYPPANLLGDFAGGGLMCVLGILLALHSRHITGKGQVVEANMVDGSAYLATMPRLTSGTPFWGRPRGENFLDGGCPWYTVYETSQPGKFVAVGALEPKFYQLLLEGLELDGQHLPERDDRSNWPLLAKVFRERFASKTKEEWKTVFDGVDACVTPVLSHAELQQGGHEQKLPVTLHDSPGKEIPSESGGWSGGSLSKGFGGEEILSAWMSWRKGVHYVGVEDGLLEEKLRMKL